MPDHDKKHFPISPIDPTRKILFNIKENGEENGTNGQDVAIKIADETVSVQLRYSYRLIHCVGGRFLKDLTRFHFTEYS